MRIYLKTTPNSRKIPFNYQQKLVGTLHKWLGENNEEHGNMSLYSFSWLLKGQLVNEGFEFPNGANFFISFYNEDRIKTIIQSIRNNPEMFCGLCVTDISIEETPDLSSRSLFYVASPIFIKRYKALDNNNVYYTYENVHTCELMKESLIHKMIIAGIEPDDSLDIKFDISYLKKHIKLITYDGIKIKANMCPIIIKGKMSTKQFAWNVGIGNSTGIGFGAIY